MAGGKRGPPKRAQQQARRTTIDDDLESLTTTSSSGITPLSFVVGLLVGALGGGIAVLSAHARHTDTSLDVAAKTLLAANKCRLGELCKDGDRPTLADGTVSHSVWDLPRYHMKSKFEEVRRVFPSTTINYLWDVCVGLAFLICCDCLCDTSPSGAYPPDAHISLSPPSLM